MVLIEFQKYHFLFILPLCCFYFPFPLSVQPVSERHNAPSHQAASPARYPAAEQSFYGMMSPANMNEYMVIVFEQRELGVMDTCKQAPPAAPHYYAGRKSCGSPKDCCFLQVLQYTGPQPIHDSPHIREGFPQKYDIDLKVGG